MTFLPGFAWLLLDYRSRVPAATETRERPVCFGNIISRPVGMFADLGPFTLFGWNGGGQAQTFAALCRSDDGKSITSASKLRRAGGTGLH